MKKHFLLLAVSILSVSIIVNAQPGGNRYKTVDDYVKSLGSLDTLNAGTISFILTKKFSDNVDKVRAIYVWITNNISMDLKQLKKGGNEKMLGEDVLKTRKANASGYAALFQDMCSVAKIRCLTVDGFIKKNTEDFNNIPDEFNHTWAVIQLGQSPETWFYVDPAMGSGYVDEKLTKYTKQFNDNYFFADKIIFNLQHLPDNMAWQLGNNGPKSPKDFFAQPIVKDNAYEFGISAFMPQAGMIKANTKKPVQFSFKASGNTKIDIVSLQMGTEKKIRNKTVDFINTNGTISFSYKFDEEESYPVTVLVNNKPVLAYFAEISE